MVSRVGKCQILRKTRSHFCACSYRFRDIKKICLLPSKSRSRSRSTIFAVTPFHAKCQYLQTSFFTFLILAQVRPVRTIVTDKHTHRNTHWHIQRTEQAHRYRRNLAYLPKNGNTLQWLHDITDCSRFHKAAIDASSLIEYVKWKQILVLHVLLLKSPLYKCQMVRR